MATQRTIRPPKLHQLVVCKSAAAARKSTDWQDVVDRAESDPNEARYEHGLILRMMIYRNAPPVAVGAVLRAFPLGVFFRQDHARRSLPGVAAEQGAPDPDVIRLLVRAYLKHREEKFRGGKADGIFHGMDLASVPAEAVRALLEEYPRGALETFDNPTASGGACPLDVMLGTFAREPGDDAQWEKLSLFLQSAAQTSAMDRQLLEHKFPMLHFLIRHITSGAWRRQSHDYTRVDLTPVFRRLPPDAFTQVENGRLPLHVAAELGSQYYNVILDAAPAAVGIRCPRTGLHPYQLAAASDKKRYAYCNVDDRMNRYKNETNEQKRDDLNMTNMIYSLLRKSTRTLERKITAEQWTRMETNRLRALEIQAARKKRERAQMEQATTTACKSKQAPRRTGAIITPEQKIHIEKKRRNALAIQARNKKAKSAGGWPS